MLKKLRAIIVGGLALCCLYLFALYLRTDGGELIKNTVSLADDAQETACPTEAAAATETPVQSAAPATPTIIPTTISGGMSIKNTSGYDIDIDAVLSAGCPIRLEADKPQILILHTHSSEAYSLPGLTNTMTSAQIERSIKTLMLSASAPSLRKYFRTAA